MIDLSMRQVIELWSDLEEARHGTNSFGGNTAEVYAYRLLSAAEDSGQGKEVSGKVAARRLFDLLHLFQEMHGVDVRVEVGRHHDGHGYEWLLDHPITARTHVRVIERKP